MLLMELMKRVQLFEIKSEDGILAEINMMKFALLLFGLLFKISS